MLLILKIITGCQSHLKKNKNKNNTDKLFMEKINKKKQL
jgi:heterodisulfide reductase subunit B